MNTLSITNQTRSNYNTIASDFSQKRQYMWKDLLPFFSYIKPGSKVLDIGCGNARAYQQLIDKKVNYLGIDFSENLINLATTKFPGIKFKVADIVNDNTWDNLKNFDCVLCLAVLHHFPTPASQLKILRQIYQSLMKDGILIISVWNLWQPKYWSLHLQQIFYKLLNCQFKWLKVPYTIQNNGQRIKINRFCYSFTKNELRGLVTRAGFTILEIKYGRNLCFVLKKVV